MKKIGVLGAGNMGGAVIRGLCQAGYPVSVFELDVSKIDELKKQCTFRLLDSAKALCEDSDILFLAVKPQALHDLLPEIAPFIRPQTWVVSIAAGWQTQRLEQALSGNGIPVRVMPNTPALIGLGALVISKATRLAQADRDELSQMLTTLGQVDLVEEDQMDAVTAISGSGPAYVFYFIDALTKAGVRQGLSESLSLKLATQTVVGAATMVQQSPLSPAELKQAVCSPGGTTIEAMEVFDVQGFAYVLENAVKACADKSRALAQNK